MAKILTLIKESIKFTNIFCFVIASKQKEVYGVFDFIGKQ